MNLKELSYEKDGEVGVITLRRPEAMNSLSYNLYMEIEDTVRGSDARALVITGKGARFAPATTSSRFSGARPDRRRRRSSAARRPAV